MSLSDRFAAQLAHPRGLAGRLVGRAMDLANTGATRQTIALLDPRPGERILDAGCGTGAALAAIHAVAGSTLYGIDRSATMIAAARGRLGEDATLAVAPIERMPGDWPAFDAVLALNVLYFAEPGGAMIASLHRALRPGGRLVAYVTCRSAMQRWAFARAGLHRLYDAAELAAALAGGGFAPGAISIQESAVAPGVKGLIARAVC